MPSSHQIADSPREIGLDPAKVEELFKRAEREVAEGLLPSCQIAIARNGKVGAMKTFGHAVQGGVDKPATDDTLYCVFSCTKAIMSSAHLDSDRRRQARNWRARGRHRPGVRHATAKRRSRSSRLLLHVGGFPNAPYPQHDWLSREKRLERFKSWRLEFPVGQRFIYHPTSGFWVLAEIIERRTGQDFRDFVRDRIALPLGLPELRLGIAAAPNTVASPIWSMSGRH